MQLKRWWPYAAAGVVVVATVATVVVVNGGNATSDLARDPSPSASTIPSLSASPSLSSAPQPSPALAGAIPMPAYPASAIPWSEVGPGWFLLAYDPNTKDDVQPPQTTAKTGLQSWSPEADEAVMLVGPSGDLYYVDDLTGFGPGQIVGWASGGMLVIAAHATADSDEPPHGRLDRIDLATGVATTINEDAWSNDVVGVLPDGTFFTQSQTDGGSSVFLLAPDFSFDHEVCHSDSWGPATTVSPDGTRVVCLDAAGDRTAVTLYPVSGGSPTQLDTFKASVGEYGLHGWWDANSFVVTRTEGDETVHWWAYDVTTKKIRDLSAVLADGRAAEFAEGLAGYRFVRVGSDVEAQDFSGARLATLPCLPSAVTGTVALAVCGAAGGTMEIVVADLTTGDLATAASFEAPGDSYLQVFPAPGGERA